MIHYLRCRVDSVGNTYGFNASQPAQNDYHECRNIGQTRISVGVSSATGTTLPLCGFMIIAKKNQ